MKGKSLKFHLGIGIILNGFGRVIQFARQMVFSRLLGDVLFGQYSFIISLVTLISIPIKGGFQALSGREIPRLKNEIKLQRGFLKTSSFVILVMTVVLGALGAFIFHFYDFTDKYSYIKPAFFGILLFTLLRSLMDLWSVQYQAENETGAANFSNTILPGVFSLALVYGYVIFRGDEKNLLDIFLIISFAIFLSVVVIIIFKKPLIWKSFRKPTEFKTREWLSEGLSLMLLSSFAITLKKLNIVMVGLFMEPTQVGYYAVADNLALLAVFGLLALKKVIGPRLAAAYQEGNYQAFRRLVKLGKLIGGGTTIVLSLPFLLLSDEVLSYYGDGFVAARIPMIIIMSAQIINAFIGPLDLSFIMMGKQNIVTRSVVLALILNAVFAALLIPRFGLLGAACAQSAGLIVPRLMLSYFYYRQWHTLEA